MSAATPLGFQPNRETKRIAEWLRALGHWELAKDILRGTHWDWNPNAREGRRQENGRSGRGYKG